MNPNNVLLNLSRGIVQNVCSNNTPIQVVQAPQVTETQICAPAQSNVIDITCLNSGASNEVNYTFTNGTATAQTIWFSALFGKQGEGANFGITNSAVDQPAFTGTGPGPGPQSNAGQDFARLVNTLIAAGPVILSKITITTATSAQRNNPLLINNNQITQNACQSQQVAGTCDACPNNNITDQFVTVFNGPFGLGANQSLGYTVNAGETVTIKLTIIGQTIYSFTPVGNGNGSCGI